jgi:hypothetical protein
MTAADLYTIAPVAGVLAVGVVALWYRNIALTDKIHERDIENLKILNEITSALESLEQQGGHHFDELRQHISERVETIREDLRRG